MKTLEYLLISELQLDNKTIIKTAKDGLTKKFYTITTRGFLKWFIKPRILERSKQVYQKSFVKWKIFTVDTVLENTTVMKNFRTKYLAHVNIDNYTSAPLSVQKFNFINQSFSNFLSQPCVSANVSFHFSYVSSIDTWCLLINNVYNYMVHISSMF